MARQRGLDAVGSAMNVAKPVVFAIEIDGIPRTGLSAREFAAITGRTYNAVLELIRAGELLVDTRGKQYVIPVSELARDQENARRLDPTG